MGALFGGDDGRQTAGLGTLGGYRDSDTLIVGRASDARSLDPARPSDFESAEVIMQVFDRLVHYEPGSNQPMPGLATSWTQENAGRSWVFELRRGVTFHDGTPFNADAVVLSVERQLDPGHRHHVDDFFYWKQYFANVEAIEKLDEYRVRIDIERTFAPFLANMSIFSMGIISPTALEKYGADIATHPVGTGPFRFASWDNGRVVLERNPSYWGGPSRFRRLVFETVEDPRQRLTALESGAIDIALNVPPEERQFIQLHPRLQLYETKANSVTYLAMNTRRPPFHDVRVRRAVNYSINKGPIVQVLWHGLAKPAHTPVPPSQWGHYQVPEPYDYDPEGARRLLDEATADGVLDPQKVYKLLVPSTSRLYLPSPERLGRAIQANLEDVGLNVEVIAQPYDKHDEAVQSGAHDLCVDGWVGDTGDPDNFLYLLLAGANADPDSGAASNLAFFDDGEVDGMLTYAQEAMDQRSRERDYARVQRLVHELAPWVPLAHSTTGIAARGDIENVRMSISGLIQYRDAYRRADGAVRRTPRAAPP